MSTLFDELFDEPGYVYTAAGGTLCWWNMETYMLWRTVICHLLSRAINRHWTETGIIFYCNYFWFLTILFV